MEPDVSPYRECIHSPFDGANTLIVESHWGAGTRIRCTVCGGCAAVEKRGAIVPERCEYHRASDSAAGDE